MSYRLPRHTVRLREGPFGVEKLCGYCGEWWLIDRFDFHRNGIGGRDNRCRACRCEYRNRRRVRRPLHTYRAPGSGSFARRPNG